MFHDEKYICPTHTTQGVGESSQLACVKLALRFGSLAHSLFSIWRHMRSIPIFTGVPGNYGLVPLLFCRLAFSPSHRKLTIQFCRRMNLCLGTDSVWSQFCESWALISRTSSEVAPMGAASVPEARGTFSLLLFVFALVNENCGATRLFDISEIQFPNSKNDLNNVTNTIEIEQNVS